MQEYVKQGGITADVGKELSDLQLKHVPLDQYLSRLNLFVAQGKITPVVTKDLTTCYQTTRARQGAAESLGGLINTESATEAACISQTLSKESATQDFIDELIALSQKNLSVGDFRAALLGYTKSGKLNEQNINSLIACYQKLYAMKQMTNRLQNLQANNASATTYADELKRAVQAGLITPEKATDLLNEYKAMVTPATALPGLGVTANLPSTEDFARLRERLQSQTIAGPTQPQGQATSQFTAAASAAELQRSQERQQRIQQMQAAMAGQAQSLLASWQQPNKMVHVAGETSKENAKNCNCYDSIARKSCTNG